MRNSRILLPLLILCLAASVYYAWQKTPRVERIGQLETATAAGPVSVGVASGRAGRLDFSGGEKRKFSGPVRDLFGPLFTPPAPVKPKAVAAPVAVAPVVEVVVPPPPPIPVRSNISRMPAFQVLGFLERNAQITAFVSLQGEIYLVKKDQVFAEEFKVAEISQEMIRISRVQGGGEVSLPLSEGKVRLSDPQRQPGPLSRPVMPVARPPLNRVN